ncbi:MAG: restriction endonuclease [Candidatus Bathyarchaeia archaeon]|nr:restriction endonuclease [Candidatus Bathyarchaeota archaeon]
MSREPLLKLATQYFMKRGYVINKNQMKDSNEEQFSDKKVDLIVKRGNEIYPVWIKEWNRTVGVNVIINVDKLAQNMGFTTPIIIAEKFSEHAKAYANRKGIRLLTRLDLIRGLKAF